MRRLGKILKSKTVWGAIATSIGWLMGQETVGLQEIIQAAGGVLAAVGVRDSFTKVGDKMDPPPTGDSLDAFK